VDWKLPVVSEKFVDVQRIWEKNDDDHSNTIEWMKMVSKCLKRIPNPQIRWEIPAYGAFLKCWILYPSHNGHHGFQ
jgi:hypothetical protein